MDKMKRRRMNVILDTVKFRKNKNAIACFDDDCQEIQEEKIFSTTVRRDGKGNKKESSTDTGNIIIFCEKHDWREMFSVTQLDNLRMPERMTSVNDHEENTNVQER